MDKVHVRSMIWDKLVNVARPDSRFHLDFNEYIPDFAGSKAATARITSMDAYVGADSLFITPDNCLEQLRANAVLDNKTQVMPTYGIRRGMVALRPGDVTDGMARYATLLDVIEQVGNYVNLEQLGEGFRFDLIVTGASAVNYSGVRFGKGHGFFDLEWAMLYQIGAVKESTPVVAFVHDCQLIDVALQADQFDTICDYIVTPTRLIEILEPRKPTMGVIWDKLEPGTLDKIPSLRELKHIEVHGTNLSKLGSVIPWGHSG